MPIDHECSKVRACPLCNPTQEMLWWVQKLLPDLLSRVKAAELGAVDFEQGHIIVRNLVLARCNEAGLTGMLSADVAFILTYKLH